jgi:uncharacterized protein (DUF433 family)
MSPGEVKAMQLEDYFEFETFETKHGPVERIRLKGHRVAIEHVIELFNQGMSPERIRQSFPTLGLDRVYATITYYLANKQAVDEYLARGETIEDEFYQEWLANPSPAVQRLRALKAQRQQAGQATP